MGKRSDYPREPRDYYRTIDPRATPPLMFHVKPGTRFIEPCAGKGDLVDHLVKAGLECVMASDIEPQAAGIFKADALKLRITRKDADCIITNTMWRREFLHAFIRHFAPQIPTWLLFDADWMHTKQAQPFLKYLTDIVSIGRLQWFEDTHVQGKDNCAWYRFADDKWGATRFWGRK